MIAWLVMPRHSKVYTKLVETFKKRKHCDVTLIQMDETGQWARVYCRRQGVSLGTELVDLKPTELVIGKNGVYQESLFQGPEYPDIPYVVSWDKGEELENNYIEVMRRAQQAIRDHFFIPPEYLGKEKP